MEPVKQTEGEPAPTQETAAEPSVEPSQEPTAEPSAQPSQEPTELSAHHRRNRPPSLSYAGNRPPSRPPSPRRRPPRLLRQAEIEMGSFRLVSQPRRDEITVRDLGGTLDAVRISVGGKTLIDGPLPSGHVWIDLLENSEVKSS